MTTKVLNGNVAVGDVVAYTVRKHWDMATRIGVIVDIDEGLLLRVVKSSNGHVPYQMVWLTELDRVVRLRGSV